MLRIVKFEPEDILTIVPREPDRTIAQSVPDHMEMARQHANYPSWTGWLNNSVMFCCGIVIPWAGMGEGWALTSDLVRANPYSFHKAVKLGIDMAAKEHKLRRLQLSIPEAHRISWMWAIRLGFTKEGAMPNYGPDGSCWLRFARYW